MPYHLTEGTVQLKDCALDYIAFGQGSKALILLQGLSVRDAKGSGASIALAYRCFARDYRVYLFDRRQDVPEGFRIEDMAQDVRRAMEALNIDSADLFGVSQGGMIAMAMALAYPEAVRKMVLGVTAPRPNPVMKNAVEGWMDCARRHDHVSLNRQSLTLMYSEQYLRRYRLLMPLLVRLAKPRNFERFARLAASVLQFDCYDRLTEIRCPVLVPGGRKDRVTTGEASEELARRLGCPIYMYEEYGHGAYEEAKDFNARALAFLRQ